MSSLAASLGNALAWRLHGVRDTNLHPVGRRMLLPSLEELSEWNTGVHGQVLYILLILCGGRLLVLLLHRLSERLSSAWEDRSRKLGLEEYSVALRRLLPVGRKSIEAIVYICAATLIIREFQALEPFASYGPSLIRAISVFFVARVVVEFSHATIARGLLHGASPGSAAQRQRSTLVTLLQNTTRGLIYFGAGMMILRELGVDPTPLLASAGIMGLTTGFGAQSLVQDLLSGLLLLFENQILIGDSIRIGEVEGVVEELTPRMTRIRDRHGRLHLVRNGELKNVIKLQPGTDAGREETQAHQSAHRDMDRELAPQSEQKPRNQLATRDRE